jgi:hypothetical protein
MYPPEYCVVDYIAALVADSSRNIFRNDAVRALCIALHFRMFQHVSVPLAHLSKHQTICRTDTPTCGLWPAPVRWRHPPTAALMRR